MKFYTEIVLTTMKATLKSFNFKYCVLTASILISEFSISTVDRIKKTGGIKVHMGYNTSSITYSSSVFKIAKDNAERK